MSEKNNKSTIWVNAYTDASLTNKAHRNGLATGGIYYTNGAGGILSRWMLDFSNFSINTSSDLEALTSAYALALVPKGTTLAKVYTDCSSNLDRLNSFTKTKDGIAGFPKPLLRHVERNIDESKETGHNIAFVHRSRFDSEMMLAHTFANHAKDLPSNIRKIETKDSNTQTQDITFESLFTLDDF